MTVIDWLLDADPSIRWQVLRDLTDAPADEVADERARVAREGMGARLLALQAADGRWGGAAWNRGWDSTMHVLMLLRDLGLDPAGDEARRAIGRVCERVTWQDCGPPGYDGNPFFAGEEEPCINAQVAAVGAYFGQAVGRIIDRLLGEQLSDGGWNCEAPHSSMHSSFNTTICVLEALLAHEQAGDGTPQVTAARLRGQEYLLERRLLRRRSTGEMIERDRKGGADWTRFAFPTWWHYDVLRGLEYLRSAGVAPDERVAEAIALVRSKRDGDGRWPLETRYPGVMPVEIDDGEGRPSRWITLRALRVLRWYERTEPLPALIRHLHGERVLVCAESGPLLDSEQRMVDLIAEALSNQVTWMIVPVSRLSPAFFDLRSGLAGTIVQKAVQYHRKLAIIGDITEYLAASRALRDWVGECNRHGEVCFLPRLDDLSALLNSAT